MSVHSGWDVAIRYHEFKQRKVSPSELRRIRKLSAQAIFERAKNILGSVVHPSVPKVGLWDDVPYEANQVELDIETTLENTSNPKQLTTGDELWMSYSVHRKQPVILSIDTSLSMTGEKLALTAVAVAVVLLQFPDDPIGIVAFENEARTLKHPEEKISLEELLERFLDIPAQGYTHLEEGIKAAYELVLEVGVAARGRPASTVLLTDGKYTAGRDPSYLASRFSQLIVLKMGAEQSSLSLCQDLAKKGHGTLCEVKNLETLPNVMYGVVKDLLRGQS